LAYRELDDAFGLTDQVGAAAFDDPAGGNEHPAHADRIVAAIGL
jgi:hypothetical protein